MDAGMTSGPWIMGIDEQMVWVGKGIISFCPFLYFFCPSPKMYFFCQYFVRMNMGNLCVPTIFIFTLIPIFVLFIVGGSEADQKMSALLKPLNSPKLSPAHLYAECNELCASKRFDEMIKNLQDKIPICKIFPDNNGAVDYGYLFSSIQELMDNIEEHQKVLKGTHHTGHWSSSEENIMEIHAKKYLTAIEVSEIFYLIK
jgi:hypothetical protein